MSGILHSPPSRYVKLLLKIEAHEIRAAFTSFVFIFTLMVAYYTLRPVRDAMASDWSDAELSWLWTSTFFISMVAVVIYGSVISRIKFRRIVPACMDFSPCPSWRSTWVCTWRTTRFT